MKKVLTILFAVLFVIAVSAFWIWRNMGVSDAAVLLPADTVALASLPDLPRSAFRWPQTALAKIGVEPEMKAFLEKPFQYLTKNKGGDDAGAILWDLKPGRIFAAVTSVSSKESGMLIGFQFWGSQKAHDSAVARLREELSRGSKTAELTREIYEGTEITSTKHRDVTVYSASVGHWGFLSNNIATIKDAVDRASGRKTEGSLAESARYREVQSELSKSPDLLVYIQPQSAIDTLLAVGQAMGAQAVPQQVEQAKKIEAIGMTTKLDGLNIHDSIFILRQNPPDVGTLSHQPMKLTSNTTIAYFDFLLDLKQYTQSASNPLLGAILRNPAAQNSPLLTLIPEAFGPECAINISWPGEVMKPEAFLAIQIKDQAKAEEAIRETLVLFPESTVTEEGSARFYNFPALQTPFANPTMTIAEGYLLVGIDPGDLRKAVTALKGGETLEKSDAFAPALPAYRTANEVFGFVNTKAIFERGYPMLRPVLIFGTAFMPGASDIIDSGKLPQTEAISKHLQPITYSQIRKKNGYLVESTGPITLNQAIVLGASAGSYFLPRGGTQ